MRSVHRSAVRTIASFAAASTTTYEGRARERAAIDERLCRALSGQRQIAFLRGEPGGGKSTIVKAFVQSLHASQPRVQVGWGQCVEHFSGREPYGPVLEALERLGHGPARERLASALRASAPSWLAQMPFLQSPDDTARLALTLPGVAPHRMLREFVTLVEVFSLEDPLVIVLEDLQWSDFGTVDLLSVLAQRPEPARLMIVGTYRPAEAAVLSHPIAQTVAALESRGFCTSIAVEGLGQHDVADYLRRRLAGALIDEAVAAFLHQHTDGNPRFLVALVDHLIANNRLTDAKSRTHWTLVDADEIVAREVPHVLQRGLHDQLRLTTAADRELLDVASVAGASFDAREVAAGLDAPLEDVESRCDRLCRVHQLLRSLGSRDWPDGSVGGQYAFVHAVYQRVLYDLLPPGRRAAVHQRIGDRLECGYAHRTTEIAAGLAHHFQHGTDRPRAVVHLGACARDAYARGAREEVIRCIEQALRLIGEMPASADLVRHELQIRQLYALALSETLGCPPERLVDNLTRALALAEQTADPIARFDLQYALVGLYANQSDFAKAAEICRPLLQPPQDVAIPAPWRAEYAYGVLALWRGDLHTAERFLARARAASASVASPLPWLGTDPGVGAAAHDGLRLWLVGRAADARALIRDATSMAERLGHPFTTASALTVAAATLVLSGRWAEADQVASRAISLSAEHGFPRWLGTARVFRGRVLVERGHVDSGLREVRDGLDVLRQTRLRLCGSLLFSLQAGACLRSGHYDEGFEAVDRGLVLCTELSERLFEPELWRLKGELLWMRADGERHPARRSALLDDAGASIEQAMTLARVQGTYALLRRARRSAARMPDANALRPDANA
jgi:tetratricopeptide (TPR) repeat protein